MVMVKTRRRRLTLLSFVSTSIFVPFANVFSKPFLRGKRSLADNNGGGYYNFDSIYGGGDPLDAFDQEPSSSWKEKSNKKDGETSFMRGPETTEQQNGKKNDDDGNDGHSNNGMHHDQEKENTNQQDHNSHGSEWNDHHDFENKERDDGLSGSHTDSREGPDNNHDFYGEKRESGPVEKDSAFSHGWDSSSSSSSSSSYSSFGKTSPYENPSHDTSGFGKRDGSDPFDQGTYKSPYSSSSSSSSSSYSSSSAKETSSDLTSGSSSSYNSFSGKDNSDYGGFGGSSSSSSYHGSSSSSSYHSTYHHHDKTKFGEFLDKINVKVPLIPVLIVCGLITYFCMVLTAFMYQMYPQACLTNTCRKSILTTLCIYKILYNLYHCRLGEIPPLLCAVDEEDDYTEEELERMKLRDGIGRALETEHQKAVLRTSAEMRPEFDRTNPRRPKKLNQFIYAVAGVRDVD